MFKLLVLSIVAATIVAISANVRTKFVLKM